MRPPVLGIDPGSRETGLVLRRGATVIEFCVVTRKGPGLPDAKYLEDVQVAAHGFHAVFDNVLVAVEGLEEPDPRKRIINVSGLLGTAMVLGSVLTLFPSAIVVPPGLHGLGPLVAYPVELRPARGKGAGKDMLRHCRSAWDLCDSAVFLARAGAA